MPKDKYAAFFSDISGNVLSQGLSQYDLKVSSYFWKDGKKGILLVKRQEEGEIEAVFIYAGEGSEKELMSLIAYSTDMAAKHCGMQSVIHIACKRTPEHELLEAVVPGMTADRYLLYVLKKPDETDMETDDTETDDTEEDDI